MTYPVALFYSTHTKGEIMLSRQKEVFQEWVDSGLKAEQQARKSRRSEEHDRLVIKLGGEFWKWRERQKEDEKYLKKEGALQVFKDAKKILDKRFYPGRNHVGIIKPTDTDPQVETYLELLHNIDCKLVAPHTEFPWLWTVRQVLCFVAREEGQPIGFRLGGVNEILPNKTFLGRGLIEAIKTAPIVNFRRRHW